ncbi:MAG: endonuclease [Chthoniobacteraceae bacterium]|nr:endonuclease [Chthoniobacteraceae bacterium]
MAVAQELESLAVNQKIRGACSFRADVRNDNPLPMNEILHKSTVLVLNRHWQAIHVKTPAEAFCMLVAGAATALDVRSNEYIIPVRWDDWIRLPLREQDNAVNTPRGAVRVPTVVVAARYAKIPLRRPCFGARGIWERDGGVCQYTGRTLSPKEGNIDHVIPRSRGGKSSWENCVLAHREVNSRKADRLPHEAGLRLRRQPFTPRVVPASVLIRNHHDVKDWKHFFA